MHGMQAVPLNYPSVFGKGAQTQATVTKRVHGGHLASDVCPTQHIRINGVEWGESAPDRSPEYQALGTQPVAGAVESHIAGDK